MVQVLKEATSDYDYFLAQILSGVSKRMGKEYTARTIKVLKNNSLELDSLVLLKEGKNFSPNIYLEAYYEAYQQGVKINELVIRLYNIYHNCTVPIAQEQFSYTFEQMKPYIIYRLVSYDRNRRLLEKVPHIRYLDLAITYHCLVREDDEGIGTIRITNEHMRHWKTHRKELQELAAENTKRLFPVSIRSMVEVIRSMLVENLTDSENELSQEMSQYCIDSSSTQNMYILSNEKGINGAACLIYSDVLHDISERFQSDFYVFPSSIHELILVPASDSNSSKEYTEMVREINATQVAPEEVLSDRIYYYSRENGLTVLEC